MARANASAAPPEAWYPENPAPSKAVRFHHPIHIGWPQYTWRWPCAWSVVRSAPMRSSMAGTAVAVVKKRRRKKPLTEAKLERVQPGTGGKA